MFTLAKQSGVLNMENNPIVNEFLDTGSSKAAGKKARLLKLLFLPLELLINGLSSILNFCVTHLQWFIVKFIVDIALNFKLSQ